MKFNFDSVKKLCNNSQQIMLYGWKHCLYEELNYVLDTDTDSPIKEIFGYTLGNDLCKFNTITLEGREIEQIKVEKRNVIQFSNAALVNIILENYKRKKEGLSLIPLIFCHDIEKNRHPDSTKPESITSREPKLNNLITNKELRRYYKFFEFKNEELKEISQVAEETITFVKLVKNSSDEYELIPTDAPWKKADWDEQITIRKNSKIHDENTLGNEKKLPWREQLKSSILFFNTTHKKCTGQENKEKSIDPFIDEQLKIK